MLYATLVEALEAEFPAATDKARLRAVRWAVREFFTKSHCWRETRTVAVESERALISAPFGTDFLKLLSVNSGQLPCSYDSGVRGAVVRSGDAEVELEFSVAPQSSSDSLPTGRFDVFEEAFMCGARLWLYANNPLTRDMTAASIMSSQFYARARNAEVDGNLGGPVRRELRVAPRRFV